MTDHHHLSGMARVLASGLFAILLVTAWSARAAAPVVVDGAWLAARLHDERVVVVDMCEEDLQYTRFHIPGAVRIGYHELIRPGGRGRPNVRLPDNELAALLGQRGIARDTHVVIYDDVGGLNAGRLFMELERLGHPRVSVLDGGLVQWILEGRGVDNRPVERQPAVYGQHAVRRNTLASLDEVKRAGANGVALLDVRSREEYTGDPKQARSGHVPGARWWPWEQAIRMDGGFVWHDAETLRAGLARLGVTDKTQPVILYCRSGHRASQTYLTLRHLGFENVRLHAGSMLEYLLETTAPLTRGNVP